VRTNPTFFAPDVNRAALISDCGRYRYWLTRCWDAEARQACFIMLNPSVADASVDDPTIRRCVGFARAWGCGGVRVVNLFAYRATRPGDMRAADDPVGPENDRHLLDAARGCHPVVAAWGVHGGHRNRDGAAAGLLLSAGVTVQCLGTTRDGRPRHPLYVPADQPLVPFRPTEARP
jgi:hypothetical protein